MAEQLLAACNAISKSRLQHWLLELASIGGRQDGGVTRETLTLGDWQARRLLIERARSLGCEIYQDDCANLFFIRPGKDTQHLVLTGSHIDTQPVGGKYDGAYGVLAGMEVLAALNEANIRTEKSLAVAIWTNEEGARFGPGAMGSSSFSAPSRLAHYLRSTDRDGVRFGDALAQTFGHFRDVPLRANRLPVSHYIELHIEQGPELERAGSSLGIVSSIQSVRWYRVHCSGRMAHAGTTPMDQRDDAMAKAISLAEQLQRHAGTYARQGLRFTIGRWQASPNAVNTIADSVEFTCDLRCEDDAVLQAFAQDVEMMASHIAGVAIDCFFDRATTHFPAQLQQVIAKACAAAEASLQLQPSLTLPSGAFHDAMYLAECCDAGMIFVPSVNGISHNAAEHTPPEQLYAGVWALAHSLLQLTGITDD